MDGTAYNTVSARTTPISDEMGRQWVGGRTIREQISERVWQGNQDAASRYAAAQDAARYADAAPDPDGLAARMDEVQRFGCYVRGADGLNVFGRVAVVCRKTGEVEYVRFQAMTMNSGAYRGDLLLMLWHCGADKCRRVLLAASGARFLEVEGRCFPLRGDNKYAGAADVIEAGLLSRGLLVSAGYAAAGVAAA